MPNYTQTLALEMPLQTEGYDVDVFNRNAQKVDVEAAAAREVSAKKVEKVGGAVAGNLAMLTADGGIGDAGVGQGALARKTVTEAVVLRALNWANGMYVLNSGLIVNGEQGGEVFIAQAATDDEFLAFCRAMMRVVDQQPGYIVIKAADAIPYIDIPVILEVQP